MKSFDELLQQTRNKIKNENILYELGGEAKWIKDVIYEYNNLGFLTWTSQPGRSYDCYVYESIYNRKYQKGDKIKCVRKQRALIRGYMKRDLARKLCDYLNQDEFLFVKTAENGKIFTGDVQFGSMCFINDEPIIRYHKEIEFDYFKDDDEKLKLHPDADQSYNLGVQLRFPLANLTNFDGKEDVVEVEIFDIRWNNNNLLWQTILTFLRKENTKEEIVTSLYPPYMGDWLDQEFKSANIVWLAGHWLNLNSLEKEETSLGSQYIVGDYYVATFGVRTKVEHTHDPIKTTGFDTWDGWNKVKEIAKKLEAKCILQMAQHKPGYSEMVIYIPRRSTPYKKEQSN